MLWFGYCGEERSVVQKEDSFSKVESLGNAKRRQKNECSRCGEASGWSNLVWGRAGGIH
jgi:hypothetical protein